MKDRAMKTVRITLAAPFLAAHLALLVPLGAYAQTAPTYVAPTYVAPTGTTPATDPTTPVTLGTPGSFGTTAPTDSKAAPKAGTLATNPSPSRGTSAATTADKKSQQKITTSLIEPTSLQDPATINARLPGLTTQPKLADIGDKLNQVMISGTPTVKNGRVTIDWTTVSRSDTGQTVNLPAPLASALRTKAQSLPAKTKIAAKGDADELYEAIRTLFAAQPASAGLTNAAGKSSGQQGGGSTPTAGGQQTTNGDVKALASKATDTSSSSNEETSVSVDTTTEGCSIRIDIPQGVVIQQEAVITTVNGKVERGACEDGSLRWPIRKTGLGCTDQIRDTEAQGLTRQYYINDKGEELPVQECALDNELIYPIVEEIGSCPMYTDESTRRVFDQAERVYRNNMNVRSIVTDCAPTGDGYALETTPEGCQFRDDFTAGSSVQQIRDFYVKNGTMFYTGSCYDGQQTYAHQFEECSVAIDVPGGMVYNAHRIFINGPSGKAYRSECTPYGAGSAITATTDGCQSVHYDYPPLQQSRGSERLYYMAGATRTYLTQCQESTAVYNWDLVVAGYQHNDEAKTSTEILAANINIPGVGVVQVSAPAVRDVSAIIPYMFEETKDIANGEPKTYASCNAYVPTDKVQVYRRADQTTYTVKVGAGAPQGPVDECTRSDESRTTFSHACAGTSPDCNPKLAGPKGNTTSGDPSCASGAVSPSTGFNWSKVETRTTTTMPAGAGGESIVGNWALKNYLQLSMWMHYSYPPSGQGSCKDTGKD
jgi:hypothetical protein